MQTLVYTDRLRLLINDLQRHTQPIRAEIDSAIARVLTRGWYILGPELKTFEIEFASYVGVEHAVGVASGTDALELALRALGIGPGDRVITVANAGMYSTIAILAAGATPVYVDVNQETMTMDPAGIQAASAIVVTHLYGRMADMPGILEAAGSIPVIEDCAQAHGADLHGRRAGAWGVAGCFSFYPTKNLGALGDGGAIVTNDVGIADRVRRLRQYGWSSKYKLGLAGGRNSRLDELQAAVLKAKLPHLDSWNARRCSIAARYNELLCGLPLILSNESGVAHLYVIRSERRDTIQSALAGRGIATDVHYPIPDYRQRSVALEYSLPVTERCCREVLTLPCFPEMTDEEIEIVAAETRQIVQESNEL